MFCKYCGSQIDGDAQFCPNCGGQVQGAANPRQQGRQPSPQQPPRQGWQPPAQQPMGAFRPPVQRSRAYGSRSRRKSPVSAGFQGRLFGIPISGKAAIIILIILVIVCVILNKTGVLS